MKTLIQPPTPEQEPITPLMLAKNLRLITEDAELDDHPELEQLKFWCIAARQDVEHYTGRYYTPQQWRHYFNVWSGVMVLGASVQSIDAVNWTDHEGAERTMDSMYYALITSEAGKKGVWFCRDIRWPSLIERPEVINITYTVGEGAPEMVQQAMLLLASHWYKNREAASVGTMEIREIPLSYRWLLDAYKTPVIA